MLITLKAAILMPHPGLTMEPQEIYRAIAETFPSEPPMLVRWVLNGNTYCWNIPVAVGETWLPLGQASALEAQAVADALMRLDFGASGSLARAALPLAVFAAQITGEREVFGFGV